MRKILFAILFMMSLLVVGENVYASGFEVAESYKNYSGEIVNVIEFGKKYKVNSLKTTYSVGYGRCYLESKIEEKGRIRIIVMDCTSDLELGEIYQSKPLSTSLSYKEDAEKRVSRWTSVIPGEFLLSFSHLENINPEAYLYVEYQKEGTYYGESEENNTFDTATPLTFGKSYEGNMSGYEDEDYYKFVLPQPGLVEIFFSEIRADNSFFAGNYMIYKESSYGNTEWIKKSYSRSDGNRLRLPAGTYYIYTAEYEYTRGYPEEFLGSKEYALQINYTKETSPYFEIEDNNVRSNANIRPLRQKITGNLHTSDDQDFFQFQVPVDSYISLDTWVPRQNHDTVTFTVYDANLKELKTATSSTTNPYLRMDEMVVKAGVFYVMVNAGKYNDYDYTIQANAACYIHNYQKKLIKKANKKSDGQVQHTCKVCGQKTVETISKIGTVSLSDTKFTYNGKKVTPSVEIVAGNGQVIPDSQYRISYEKGRKNPGTYKVTVRFQGNYSGTITKKFTITPTPSKVTGFQLLDNGRTEIRWEKQRKQVDGYEIQYSDRESFPKKSTKTVLVNKNVSKKIAKNVDMNKMNYIRIRTYKNVKKQGKKTKIYSQWTTTGFVG